ncbi:MAG: helix-turn-helix domain-containing protein [Gammaproteobacteria bacterium]|nr:helix-turn-helix domain-containing protein [Gammaproteobacteria bacterium]MYD75932.1 helix-turn-helix domain-containing protein [Gammaproteobacteria bacterium]
MKKLYVVRLTEEERSGLHDLVHKGRVAAYRRHHAQVLLLSDQGEHGPGHPDRVVAERVEVAHRTVEKIRERFVLHGLEAALGRQPRSRERSSVLDGEGEAHLVAIACSEPPEGCSRWTLHLLADELKTRGIVASISIETVRRVLKKRNQAVAPTDVVHPAEAGRGLRVRHGTGSRRVHAGA